MRLAVDRVLDADGLYSWQPGRRGGMGTKASAICLRIVVLHVGTDVWCDRCGVPSAVTITYVVEENGRPPGMLHCLTYCESCEDR
jgi:hypothetical protein